jgi:hypothetical protein
VTAVQRELDYLNAQSSLCLTGSVAQLYDVELTVQMTGPSTPPWTNDVVAVRGTMK